MRCIVITVIFLILSLHTTSYSSDVIFLTHDIEDQTYIDANNELRGIKNSGRRAFNVELVREMIQLNQHSQKTITNYPFKRALYTVQTQPNYALFNVNRTAQRESTVQWVGPLQSSTSYFYESKEKPTGIKTVEEAKQVQSICVLRGNFHQESLVEMGFNNLYLSTSYENCYEMLSRNRVDLAPVSDITARSYEGTELFSNLQSTQIVITESKGYIAFSQNIPVSEVERWQESLDFLKKSGRYDQLLQEYYSPK